MTTETNNTQDFTLWLQQQLQIFDESVTFNASLEAVENSFSYLMGKIDQFREVADALNSAGNLSLQNPQTEQLQAALHKFSILIKEIQDFSDSQEEGSTQAKEFLSQYKELVEVMDRFKATLFPVTPSQLTVDASASDMLEAGQRFSIKPFVNNSVIIRLFDEVDEGEQFAADSFNPRGHLSIEFYKNSEERKYISFYTNSRPIVGDNSEPFWYKAVKFFKHLPTAKNLHSQFLSRDEEKSKGFRPIETYSFVCEETLFMQAFNEADNMTVIGSNFLTTHPYNFLTRNCSTVVFECLQKLHTKDNKSLFPAYSLSIKTPQLVLDYAKKLGARFSTTLDTKEPVDDANSTLKRLTVIEKQLILFAQQMTPELFITLEAHDTDRLATWLSGFRDRYACFDINEADPQVRLTKIYAAIKKFINQLKEVLSKEQLQKLAAKNNLQLPSDFEFESIKKSLLKEMPILLVQVEDKLKELGHKEWILKVVNPVKFIIHQDFNVNFPDLFDINEEYAAQLEHYKTDNPGIAFYLIAAIVDKLKTFNSETIAKTWLIKLKRFAYETFERNQEALNNVMEILDQLQGLNVLQNTHDNLAARKEQILSVLESEKDKLINSSSSSQLAVVAAQVAAQHATVINEQIAQEAVDPQEQLPTIDELFAYCFGNANEALQAKVNAFVIDTENSDKPLFKVYKKLISIQRVFDDASIANLFGDNLELHLFTKARRIREALFLIKHENKDFFNKPMQRVYNALKDSLGQVNNALYLQRMKEEHKNFIHENEFDTSISLTSPGLRAIANILTEPFNPNNYATWLHKYSVINQRLTAETPWLINIFRYKKRQEYQAMGWRLLLTSLVNAFKEGEIDAIGLSSGLKDMRQRVPKAHQQEFDGIRNDLRNMYQMNLKNYQYTLDNAQQATQTAANTATPDIKAANDSVSALLYNPQISPKALVRPWLSIFKYATRTVPPATIDQKVEQEVKHEEQAEAELFKLRKRIVRRTPTPIKTRPQ